MAYTNLGQNTVVAWPSVLAIGINAYDTSATNTTLDAQDEEVHFIGHLELPPGTASATFDTNTTIQFQAGTVTWNTGTTVRIGVQDVDATTGAPGRGDGNWDCYKDMVAGTDTISTGWNTITMASGSKSVNQGDLIAICIKVTVKGAETLSLPVTYGGAGGFTAGRPLTVSSIGSGFVARAALVIVAINFNGIYATLQGALPYTSRTATTFNNTSTPDERGNFITFPFACKVRGFVMRIVYSASSTTFDVVMYSDPSGTPAAMSGGTVTVDTDTLYSTSGGDLIIMLPAGVEVAANTKIAVVLKPNGATSIGYTYIDFPSTSVAALFPGGQNVTYAYRTDGSGAFSETTTRKAILYPLISDIDFPSGGGLITHPGMAGGCRG